MKSTENLYGNSLHAQQQERGSFTNEPFATETCLFAKLGQMDYVKAWDAQRAIARRREHCSIPDSLILLEHPHTYTLGRRGKIADVLVEGATLKQMGVQICYVDRGGQVTYHGPGQLVAYPIVDLRPLGGPATYVRTLEAVLMNTFMDFGIETHRKKGLVGIWVGDAKISSIGIKVSQGITTHGVAINVNPDLSYFRNIVPCGIENMPVTSLEKLLGTPVSLEKVAKSIVHHFGILFGRTMEESTVFQLLGSSVGPLPKPS